MTTHLDAAEVRETGEAQEQERALPVPPQVPIARSSIPAMGEE